MDSLVVMPPAIEVQQKWLVTTVVKAEYLPVMDSNFGGGAGGGDFFFQVRASWCLSFLGSGRKVAERWCRSTYPAPP